MSFPKYPRYKDSGVEWLGEVPEHWEVGRLKQIAEVSPSNVDKKTYDTETAIKLCNYTDVYYNDLITTDTEFMVATASLEQIEKFTLRGGDTIITKDSETANDIAVAAYVPEDLPGVVCGYHLSLIRPRAPDTGAFIKRYFDSTLAKSFVEVLANGLTRVGLTQYAIDNLLIPLPPLAERRAISSFLDCETAKIDTLIAEQRRLIGILKEKRQAVISNAVTRGVDPDAPMKPSGVEWLGDVPAHWVVWKLSHAFETIGSGTTPNTQVQEYYAEGDIPWVNTGDLRDNILNDCAKRITKRALVEHTSLRIFPAESLVVAMYGATIGKLALLKFPATVNQACCVFGGKSSVEVRFLFYWLLGLREQVISLATGGGQPNISQEILRSLRVAAPPRIEQLLIASHLDRITVEAHALIAQAERAIALLQERRTALISAAVTGKIDVRKLVEAT